MVLLTLQKFACGTGHPKGACSFDCCEVVEGGLSELGRTVVTSRMGGRALFEMCACAFVFPNVAGLCWVLQTRKIFEDFSHLIAFYLI